MLEEFYADGCIRQMPKTTKARNGEKCFFDRWNNLQAFKESAGNARARSSREIRSNELFEGSGTYQSGYNDTSNPVVGEELEDANIVEVFKSAILDFGSSYEDTLE